MSAALPEALKSAAWERWQRLGWPTTHDEAWRNFSTRPLQELALTGGITGGRPVAREVIAGLPSPRVVFSDGRYVAAWSVTSDAVALRSPGEGEIDRLTPADGALEALNTALLGDGVVLEVASGVDAGTFHVVHLVSGQGTAHVRTVVRLADDARLALGVMHLGLGDGGYLMNAVTELELAPGATLALAKVVREGPAGAHLEAVHARVAARATLGTYTLSLGGARVRTGVTVTLDGPAAVAEVDGLYHGQGTSKLDHVTDIRHAVGQTRSAETWAGVLDERAEGGFQGIIRIDRGAVGSATRQLTRTLLLSNEAEAHARPELHIDCDDVQASHGATVGQLDALEQFYLESRGIAPEAARRISIRAFIERHLAQAPAALYPLLAAAVTRELGPGPREDGDDV